MSEAIETGVSSGNDVILELRGLSKNYGPVQALKPSNLSFRRDEIHARNIRSAILSPRREHSRKPDEGYVEAAKMAGPYPKADLFSREQRQGWDAWGNEITKFNHPKPELELA